MRVLRYAFQLAGSTTVHVVDPLSEVRTVCGQTLRNGEWQFRQRLNPRTTHFCANCERMKSSARRELERLRERDRILEERADGFAPKGLLRVRPPRSR